MDTASTHELTIIGAPASNFVWMARIACMEKGIAHTLVPTMPHTPEVDAIHPLGKIPVLKHGSLTLFESRAICLYIDKAFAGPALTPLEPTKAAQVEQWLSLLNTHVDLIWTRKYLASYFFPATTDGTVDRATIDAVLPQMQSLFAVLDRGVQTTGYLGCDCFTLADMDLLPMLFYLNQLPESRRMLMQAVHLRTYFERHMQRPSVLATLPDTMPDRIALALAAYAA